MRQTSDLVGDLAFLGTVADLIVGRLSDVYPCTRPGPSCYALASIQVQKAGGHFVTEQQASSLCPACRCLVSALTLETALGHAASFEIAKQSPRGNGE